MPGTGTGCRWAAVGAGGFRPFPAKEKAAMIVALAVPAAPRAGAGSRSSQQERDR